MRTVLGFIALTFSILGAFVIAPAVPDDLSPAHYYGMSAFVAGGLLAYGTLKGVFKDWVMAVALALSIGGFFLVLLVS